MTEQINHIAGLWWSWMWPMFWQAGLLITLIFVIDHAIGRRIWPQVRYALWLLVLVKLILPPTFTSPTSVPSHILSRIENTAQIRSFSSPVFVNNVLTESFDPAALKNYSASTNIARAETFPSEITQTSVIYSELSTKGYIFLIWVIAVIGLIALLVFNSKRLRKNITTSPLYNQLPEWFTALMVETAETLNMRTVPRVVLSQSVSTPAVFGVWRPVLIMPAEEISKISKDQARHFLLHEFAHIKRGDLVILAFEAILQIIYWFNPLVWLARTHIKNLRELCCDATVASILKENSIQYRQTLLDTARRLLTKAPAPALGLLGLFENHFWLVDRLRWLEKENWKHRRLSVFAATVVIAVMSICVLPMAGQDTTQQFSQDPTGQWISVDLVKNVNDFNPGKKNWKDELFFKQVEFRPDGTTNSFFSWKDDWILHEDGRTKAQFYMKQIDGQTYLFLPWLSGDVTIRGRKPAYYILRRASAGEKPPVSSMSSASGDRAGYGAFRPIMPVNSVKEFDDVRDKDLSKLSPARIAAIIATLDFNKDTIWPRKNLPHGKQPEKLLEDAMNPGLGVHKLHQEGITGKGVNVAIIDQPLYQDHPEFAGKIADYFDTGCDSESSMHGPSVASLLVGTNCGTAPDAKVFYAAAPSWLKDSAYYAKALDWIVEQNAKIPDGQKIRVVSVSAAPSGQGSPFDKNQQMWDAAYARAEAAGILILDCTNHHGFIWRCNFKSVNRENPSLCASDIRRGQKSDSGNDILFAPSGPRAMAEQYQKGRFTYHYSAKGGQSWSIPYVAGVLAMGWQVNPELKPGQMKELLFKSAATGPNGEKVINPPRFIAMVKTAKP